MSESSNEGMKRHVHDHLRCIRVSSPRQHPFANGKDPRPYPEKGYNDNLHSKQTKNIDGSLPSPELGRRLGSIAVLARLKTMDVKLFSEHLCCSPQQQIDDPNT